MVVWIRCERIELSYESLISQTVTEKPFIKKGAPELLNISGI